MEPLAIKNIATPRGRYRISTYEADLSIPAEERKRRILAGEGIPKRVSPWHKNLVVSSDGYGLNVICRQLVGDTSIPIEVSELQFGTGTTAPVAGNTGLETMTVEDVARATQSISNGQVTMTFFAADLDMANGTYTELGIFCGTAGSRRLFARSLISPSYTKGSAEDTTVDYVIDFTGV